MKIILKNCHYTDSNYLTLTLSVTAIVDNTDIIKPKRSNIYVDFSIL